MRADGIVRRFDELGRINIPKEIRTKLFGTKYTDGEPMEIFMDRDEIIIRKFEENKDMIKAGQKIGYNKAIDDFVKLAKEHNWNIRNRNENEFIYGAIDRLAEQLKAGGENE